MPLIGLPSPPQRLDIVGLKPQRLVEIVLRSLDVTQRQQNEAPCTSCSGKGRTKGHCLIRVGFGFLQFARPKVAPSPDCYKRMSSQA